METNPTQESLSNARQVRNVDARLRHLDVDDLYLLSFLGDGKRLADSARALSLSQPAITQRVHKIEQAMGFDLLERSLRGTRLTERGLFVCRRASEAIVSLEKFFDGMTTQSDCVAVTGAWAAWIIAGTLTRIPEEHRSIDVEFISANDLLSLSRDSSAFAHVAATLHRKSVGQMISGFYALASIERPITLWTAPHIDLQNLAKPLPLLEVSRDDALLDATQVQEIEAQCANIRGVRFAGTVAGAIKMAATGQGVLLAPQREMERELGLVQALPLLKSNKAIFELLVSERAPVLDLATLLISVIK